MSFYGNQYLSFNKIFYDFIFKNTGLTGSDNTVATLSPLVNHDHIIFDTANRWINIIPRINPDNSEHINGISLMHNTPGDVVGIIAAGNLITDPKSVEEKIQLQQGDMLSITNFHFDEMGHYVKNTITPYKIPNITLNTGDVNSIGEQSSGTFIIRPSETDTALILEGESPTLTIGHKKRLFGDNNKYKSQVVMDDVNSDRESYIEFDNGNYRLQFLFPEITCDTNGHIISTQTKLYEINFVGLSDTVGYVSELQQQMSENIQTINNLSVMDTKINDDLNILKNENAVLDNHIINLERRIDSLESGETGPGGNTVVISPSWTIL